MGGGFSPCPKSFAKEISTMPKKKKIEQPKKVVEVPKQDQSGVQVHFGNVKLVELRLLEAIAKNTQEIVKVLKDVKEEK